MKVDSITLEITKITPRNVRVSGEFIFNLEEKVPNRLQGMVFDNNK